MREDDFEVDAVFPDDQLTSVVAGDVSVHQVDRNEEKEGVDGCNTDRKKDLGICLEAEITFRDQQDQRGCEQQPTDLSDHFRKPALELKVSHLLADITLGGHPLLLLPLSRDLVPATTAK